MLDFSHIVSNPNLDIQMFVGEANATAGVGTGEWKTWVKPRGAKFVYMIGVGGGGSGGNGLNTAGTSGGGAGGGSGAQSNLLIPAMFLPDVLYIQAGLGGVGQPTSGFVPAAGTPTYVAIEPWTTLAAQLTVLFANAGTAGGTAATTTAGGVAGTAAAAATIANMPLAGKGAYQFFAGLAGTAGGPNTGVGVALTPFSGPTGLMVMSGTGGGGCNAGTASAGGIINGVGFGDNFPTIPGGPSVSGSTFIGHGSGGRIVKPFQYYGGSGGGGNTGNTGGTAKPGDGGNGAPGCGGGGGGGGSSTVGSNALAKPGDGGAGFVYIYSW